MSIPRMHGECIVNAHRMGPEKVVPIKYHIHLLGGQRLSASVLKNESGGTLDMLSSFIL